MKTLILVMPVFNQLHVTKITCESLLQCTEDFVLIVVDDGCTDGTKDYILSLEGTLKDRLIYIANPENLGVNASWNVGLRKAMTLPHDHICIINNDLHFTQNWAKPLISALDNDGYSLVSPYSTEIVLPPDFPRGSTRHTNPVHIDILGACFMFKKSLIDQIGLFPEQMRHYFGDNWIMDICKKSGLKVGHIYNSYLHHYFCVTSNKLDNNYWFKHDGDAYNEYCTLNDPKPKQL